MNSTDFITEEWNLTQRLEGTLPQLTNLLHPMGKVAAPRIASQFTFIPGNASHFEGIRNTWTLWDFCSL